MRATRLLLASILMLPCAATRALVVGDFLSRTASPDGGNAFALPYRINVPAACVSRRCPVLLFLHGAGETGSNNTAQLGNRANGAFQLSEAALALGQPVIMVAPQAPEWWANEGPMAGTADVLDDVQREFGFDPGRVYVTGLSMGGGGTNRFMQYFDAVAAAAVPVCPAGAISGSEDRSRLWPNPMWFFHAANDGTVDVANSRDSVSNMRAGGGDPLYTEYTTGDHGIWTQSYGIVKLVPWILAQRWRMPMVATAPLVNLAAPTAAARLYTNASSLSVVGTTAPADALPTVVNYSFAALTGMASGTASFNTGPLAIPPNTTSILRLQATGTSYVSALGGNSTFSRSVRVTHPAVANRAPRVALWVEPVARVGVPLRMRALVDDDEQPQVTPTLAYTKIEGPAATIEVDAADSALAWWTPTTAGLYRFQLTANDGAATTTTLSAVLVLAAAASRPTLAANNAGGSAYISGNGTLFAADSGFTGGTAEALSGGFTTTYGSEDDVLYQSTRRGNSFSYALPVPNGRYLVALHFAEWRFLSMVAHGIDAQLEGSSVLAGLDLYRWAGSRQALRMGFATTVSDGTLNIAIQKSAAATGEARLDAFEILALEPEDLLLRDGFE